MTTPLGPGGHRRGFAATLRHDRWWVGSTLTLLGLGGFVVYSTWAAFQGAYYWASPYLSPFYSPTLLVKTGAPGAAPLDHAWLGMWPSWWPAFVPASPAFLILIFPLSFRFTCYYYRKAYYRSFAGTPPACAVGAIPQLYEGETGLLVFQNLHRYALYFALVFIVVLYYDAFAAFFRDGRFGMGVGTFVLLINATFLAMYTLGCHSFRHLVGGRIDCFSAGTMSSFSHGIWKQVSWLNERHMQFAWMSLFWVGFSDAYVRLVSMNVIADLNTWS